MPASLKKYLEAFEAASEGSPDGHALCVNGLVVAATDQLLEWTGHTRESAIGRSVLDFTAPECHEQLREHVFAGRTNPIRMTGLRSDGTRVEFELTGININDGTQNLVRIVRFVRRDS